MTGHDITIRHNNGGPGGEPGKPSAYFVDCSCGEFGVDLVTEHRGLAEQYARDHRAARARKVTVTVEHPDGRLTKWTGTGEVEHQSGEPYSWLRVTSPDLLRVSLVSSRVESGDAS